jgi:tellurite resistance protein
MGAISHSALSRVPASFFGIALLPYTRPLAEAIYIVGAVFTLAFAAWRTGLLWQGGRDHSATTPVLYLPTVAGGFVMSGGAGALGYPDGPRHGTPAHGCSR